VADGATGPETTDPPLAAPAKAMSSIVPRANLGWEGSERCIATVIHTTGMPKLNASKFVKKWGRNIMILAYSGRLDQTS
jgi:hypothetical protein